MKHLALAALPLLITLLCSCGGSQPADREPGQTYEVDGVITLLPGGPGTELMIQHERIDDFVNAAGDTVGMSAMTMGFPTAEGVDLAGFAAGDSVSIRFEVRWGQPRPLELTRIDQR